MRSNILTPIRDFLLDLIFPRECLSCSGPESYLCLSCAYRIPLLVKQSCPVCAVENLDGRPCLAQCSKQTYLDQLLVTTDYHNSDVIPSAIHLFKYKFSRDLSASLSIPLLQTFQKFLSCQTLISCVPIHKNRLKHRGFNQSELLAKQLSYQLQLPYQPLLKRVKNTKSQAELTRKARLKNLKYAFQAFQKLQQLHHVTLIDDVCTTGSTLNECARTLKMAGVSYVTGLVVAKSFLSLGK